MNKADLSARLADGAGITKKDADRFLSLTLNLITQSLSEGERVHLVGFGSFEVKLRSDRVGRDWKTGELLKLPDSYFVQFRAGKKLKDAMKEFI